MSRMESEDNMPDDKGTKAQDQPQEEVELSENFPSAEEILGEPRAEDDNVIDDFAPLFGDDEGTYSEDQLTGAAEGEDQDEPEEKKSGPKDAAKASPKDKTGEEADEKKADEEKPPEDAEEKPADGAKSEADKQKAEEPEGKDESKDEKPPEGFVTIKALQDERRKRREVSAEVRALEEQFRVLQEEKSAVKDEADDKATGFEVLSDDEFDQLAEDDPPAATKYLKALREHEKRVADIDKQKAEREAFQRDSYERIQKCVDRIEKAVPGIYDEDSEVNSTLFDFVASHGLDENFVNVMTDPGTRIILKDGAGKDRMYLLAEGAASFIEMINNLHGKMAAADPEAVKKSLRGELEKELRESITKEILDKMKSSGSPSTLSLGDLPGAEDKPASGVISEAQYARMSAEQRKKALGG
jgi:hypothetical protein